MWSCLSASSTDSAYASLVKVAPEMTSTWALCAWITSSWSTGVTYCVISAERARSVGIWSADTSVTRPDEITTRTWTSPNWVGITAPVNEPLAGLLVGTGVGLGVAAVAGVALAAGVGVSAGVGAGCS